MKKDWIARELTIEILVGVFIIMIFLGLGYFTIMLSKEAWFGNKEQVEVVFNDVMGLREGDNVVLRGMPVGKVKMMELQPDGVHVTAIFNQGVDPVIREDYQATIIASSILGGRNLLIDEGSEGASPLNKDVVLVGQQPYDIVADAAELIYEVRKGVVQGRIVENFQEMADAAKDVTSRLRDGKGSLGKLLSEDDTLYDDLAAAVASIRDLSGRLEKGEGTLGKLMAEDDGLYDDIVSAAESLSVVAKRIEDGRGSMGKLLSEDTTLYDEVLAAAEALKNLSTSLDKGEGSLGKLMKDEALYNEVKGAVGDVRAAIDDMRETTPVATFTSIFFGVF